MVYAFNNGAEVQLGTFNALLKEGRKTVFGKEFNFDTIHTISQYMETVPLFTYNSIKPYIQRMMGGEQSVLWSGDINWFAKSS